MAGYTASSASVIAAFSGQTSHTTCLTCLGIDICTSKYDTKCTVRRCHVARRVRIKYLAIGRLAHRYTNGLSFCCGAVRVFRARFGRPMSPNIILACGADAANNRMGGRSKTIRLQAPRFVYRNCQGCSVFASKLNCPPGHHAVKCTRNPIRRRQAHRFWNRETL